MSIPLQSSIIPDQETFSDMSPTAHNVTTSAATIDARSVKAVLGPHMPFGWMCPTDRISIVSVHGQTRRLGSLLYLLGRVSAGRQTEWDLKKISSTEAAFLKANADSNGDMTGCLTTAPSSVRHYAEAAKDLNLLTQQGAVFRLTTLGRFLVQAVRPDFQSPYPLGTATKVFFLNAILGADYFGTAAVLRALIDGHTAITEMASRHQSDLSQILQTFSQATSNLRYKSLVRDRLISVQSWKKTGSYSRQLVSAKLHWLADLGIVRFPVSTQSHVVVDSKHADWISHWAEASNFADDHLFSLLLRYSCVLAPNSVDRNGENLCLALERAFSCLANGGPLAKIRLVEFLLFLLCFHPTMLLERVIAKETLFPMSIIDCGKSVYTIDSAARRTQSCIVCAER